jgi:ribosomal protein S18
MENKQDLEILDFKKQKEEEILKLEKSLPEKKFKTNMILQLYGYKFNLFACQINDLNLIETTLIVLKDKSKEKLYIDLYSIDDYLKDIRILKVYVTTSDKIKVLKDIVSRCSNIVSTDTKSKLEFEELKKLGL